MTMERNSQRQSCRAEANGRSRKRAVLAITIALVLLIVGIGYWALWPPGSVPAPLPPWLDLPDDARVLVSRSPVFVGGLYEGPTQYIRVRFAGPPEKVVVVLTDVLTAWNYDGEKPEWNAYCYGMRQHQPKWLRRLMLPDEKLIDGYHTQFSDGGTRHLDIVVIPNGSGAIAEIVVESSL